MLDQLPKEILFRIIRYQMLFGDYNPTIFSKHYKEIYQEYIDEYTEWNKNN